MRRLVAGDREAYATLVRRHLPGIVGLAARMLRDRAAAEDVAQEVFLRLWQHGQGWRFGDAQVTTWLHRVGMNLCLDRLAKPREAPLDGVPEPIEEQPSLAAKLYERTVAARVGAALSTLPASQRAAIVLCHYQGLRNVDAAEILEVSVEALESLLARGRRTLRKLLKDAAPDLLAGMGDDRWN